ncbi:glycosyltransferase family 2 protein [Methylobacter sp. S3L5C]|uniref:glycosyltransferase family 2 protein n=1 Tax=Methylobacter sp. S3L5C TaxID=2839024 RepID=UPI001FAD18DE|nr:glycosyltransferase family 2 protein [Methylobacter sp. S3L5C]UOA08405.1 glycosyltransferase family 2 protein [Methylobacter sp. S3L5C]
MKNEHVQLEADNAPAVAILMGTYNGGKYIAEQLDSICRQTFKNWKIIISDDGSIDNTLDIIRDYQKKTGSDRIILKQGPSTGFADNFMALASDSDIKADYYFFSDQDDIWLPDKLERAVNCLKVTNANKPSLYGSSTLLGDEHGVIYEKSHIYLFPKNFRNAIVQCVVGGNSLAFNQAFKNIIEQISPVKVVSHDWWMYQLITAIDGYFYYDEEPTLIYRQHPQAVVGANTSMVSRINRVSMVLKGRFKNWNDINILALDRIRHLMSTEAVETLHYFKLARTAKSFKDRVRLLNISGVFRQSRQGTVSLFIAVIIQKI